MRTCNELHYYKPAALVTYRFGIGITSLNLIPMPPDCHLHITTRTLLVSIENYSIEICVSSQRKSCPAFRRKPNLPILPPRLRKSRLIRTPARITFQGKAEATALPNFASRPDPAAMQFNQILDNRQS